MSSFSTPVIVVLLCLTSLAVLSFIFWLYTMLVVATWRLEDALDTKGQLIFPAPTIWIIRGLIGWLYIREGEQIGIIGNRIYKKSGYFLENPLHPQRKVIVSCNEQNATISMNAITRESVKIKADVDVKFSVRQKFANEILQNTNPEQSLKINLENLLTEFFREYDFETIFIKPWQVQEDLKYRFQQQLPFYEIIVEAMSVAGERVEMRDQLLVQREILDQSYIDQLEEMTKRLSGDSTTDAPLPPLPDGKVRKKRKGK